MTEDIAPDVRHRRSTPGRNQVPPRVTYWTGTWDPAKEAISKEVDLLRRREGHPVPVVAYSPGNRTRIRVRDRVLTLSVERWWTLRAVAGCLEPLGEISHVFGDLAAWHWMQLLRRRPVIFTVVSGGASLPPAAYDHVTIFVAESADLAKELEDAGVSRDRVRLIYPGVDLTGFAPAPTPASSRFRVLFASWPEQPSQLEPRGVLALIEAARRCPEMEVVLLLRKWGDHDGTRQAVATLAPPPNVFIEELGGRSMADVYAGVHACAALFAPGHGKSTPNSLIESMACGRPVLMGEGCGIRAAVSEAGAGVIAGPHVDGVVAAVGALRANWNVASTRARALAETMFGHRAFLEKYSALYGEVAAGWPADPVR